MKLLTIALAIFILTHLIPAFPALKQAVILKIGRPAYIAMFSAFSLVSLGLIIYAKSVAPFVHVYEPAAWSRHLALFLMVPATILGIASFLPGHIRKVTRIPIFYAVILWVAAHLMANGDQASVMLFGSLGAYAIFSQVIKKYQVARDTDQTAVHYWADIAAVIGGLGLYTGLLHLHAYVIGITIWY